MLVKAPNEHVEYVKNGEYLYQIFLNGTLDGFNTAHYPENYSGFHREEPIFEPNEYVIIENTGDADVVNPRLVINGKRNWYSVGHILSGVIRKGMTEAEKAMAIFSFSSGIDVQCHENDRRVGPFTPDVGPFNRLDWDSTRYERKDQKRYDKSNPSRNSFKERANPVKAANCYYCSGCQYSAANFVILCRQEGLTARAVFMCPINMFMTHCVAEVWYDDDWHLFDPERSSFYLEEDNLTIASYEDLHKNPRLASRTHDGGFASKGMNSHASDYEKYYPPSVMPVEKDWVSPLAMTLRPSEKFIWKWGHEEKFRIGNNPRNKEYLPYRLANGRMIYQPELTNHVSRRGMLSELNIKTTAEDGRFPAVHSDIAGETSFVIYKVKTAYPVVGGVVGGKFYRKSITDQCRILVSIEDSDWIEVWSADQTGKTESYVAIDGIIDPRPNPARYEYYVKYEFEAGGAPTDAGVDEIYIESDVQMSGASLPSLSVGKNEIVYQDDTKDPHPVRITHGWKESAENRPPLPPANPLIPTDGARDKLTSTKKLRWSEAIDPDKEKIVDYHIQVSPRFDMLYPVSPNFNRILFSERSEWEFPKGWLLPGKRYFWRVRAKDKRGAWSQWSEVWSFTVY